VATGYAANSAGACAANCGDGIIVGS
jgi:hypothetical protein